MLRSAKQREGRIDQGARRGSVNVGYVLGAVLARRFRNAVLILDQDHLYILT
jgi:hypothetical protein